MNRSSLAGIGLFLVATLAIPAGPGARALRRRGRRSAQAGRPRRARQGDRGYVEAAAKNKNVDKARNDVAAEIDKFRKRLKDRDPLALTVDLGKSLWESLAYESAKGVKKGKVAENKSGSAELGMDFVYATWAPPKYDPKKAYPLILCIPDKGEKADGPPHREVDEPGDPRERVLARVPMPEDAALWSETGSQGKWGGAANLLTVFKEVSHTYATDFDRVSSPVAGGVSPRR
jgi:hypothetical protein